MVIFHPFFDVAFLLYHFLMVFQTSHPSHQALKKPRNWTSASATACNCDRTRPSGRLIIPKPCGFLQFFFWKNHHPKGKAEKTVSAVLLVVEIVEILHVAQVICDYVGVSWHGGISPKNHPFVHRVFHDFHHPFWGPTPILGNPHIEYLLPSQTKTKWNLILKTHIQSSNLCIQNDPTFKTHMRSPWDWNIYLHEIHRFKSCKIGSHVGKKLHVFLCRGSLPARNWHIILGPGVQWWTGCGCSGSSCADHMGVSLNGGTPISHPKMIMFSRKTHGCWGNPPFSETTILLWEG